MPRRPVVLFYIQHLLGIGHLVRGARVARALMAGGMDVTVVVGGELPAGLDFGAASLLQLPPVKAGPDGFADLVTPDGRIFGPEDRAARRDTLLACFEALDPDVLILEAFPFGRRQMRFELLPLLDAAKARHAPPLIVSSIRDILQLNRKPGRDLETVDLVRHYFDVVLVHGDPDWARLDDSFAAAGQINDRIRYTGLVGPDAAMPATDEDFDVIVSVGGGAVGGALIRAALAAKPVCRLAEASWLIVTGPNLPDPPAELPVGVTLRRFVPDLPARFRQARLSISQAGYNTVADLMAAPGCRPVLVPYAADGETEQTQRAMLLVRHGRAAAISEKELDGPALADVIDKALDLRPTMTNSSLDGAVRSAAIIMDELARRAAFHDGKQDEQDKRRSAGVNKVLPPTAR